MEIIFVLILFNYTLYVLETINPAESRIVPIYIKNHSSRSDPFPKVEKVFEME